MINFPFKRNYIFGTGSAHFYVKHLAITSLRCHAVGAIPNLFAWGTNLILHSKSVLTKATNYFTTVDSYFISIVGSALILILVFAIKHEVSIK